MIMDKKQAQEKIESTFESPFDKGRFASFIRNLLNYIDESKAFHARGEVKEMFKHIIKTYERLGTYTDPDGKKVDIIIAYLQKGHSLDHARVTQRNFAAKYLSDRGEKEAGLFAFVSPDEEDWRFSLVKMDYRFEEGKDGKVKVKEEFTPARRWSFLVGANEKSHTAKRQLVPIIADDEHNPTLAQLEEAFNIEKATKEFFEKYRDLFLWTKEELDKIVEADQKVKTDFDKQKVNTVDFAKKLLGQIVFLYFLQKKGWFGVERDKAWGTGSKRFLRDLFDGRIIEYKNFFNDVLEPLFYDALARDRSDVGHFNPLFKCKIPFLNGGLFDPINDYDWAYTDILLPNKLFSNTIKTKEGDIGNGILDIFDRFNFTVKEDEPLEKEVAVDPEMLGKVFENLLEVKDRKSKGTYYTPREIVHYMCQQSLINYLDAELNMRSTAFEKIGKQQLDVLGNAPDKGQLDLSVEHKSGSLIPKEDIGTLIKYGEQVGENEARVEAKGRETYTYFYRLPETIRQNAKSIDQKLANIKVCDPAIGSGAFLVGMMNEIVKARNVLTAYLVPPDKGGNRGAQEQNSNPLNPPYQGDLSSFPPDKGGTQGGVENFPPDKGGLRGVRTMYHFKRDCIENSLYGVDIDPGAVEIAKLRLWLSLVVDEEDIKQIKPLPNLDYKIVRGNSLLGVEKTLFNDALFKELEYLKPLLFNETSPKKKQEYKNQIDGLISQITKGHKEFDFEVYFSEMFHEKGGFDVVIANPPYVDSERMTKSMPDQRRRIAESYSTAKGNWDLYVPFWELGFDLLSEKGNAVFITPNKWLSIKYGEKLRELLQEYVHRVGNCDQVDVFEAGNSPVVLFIDKAKSKTGIQIDVFDKNYLVEEKVSAGASILSYGNWGLLLSRNIKLLLRIIQAQKKVGDDYAVENPFTVSEAYAVKELIQDLGKLRSYDRKRHFKFVNTGTIDKYLFLWGKKRTTYLKKKYLFPAVVRTAFLEEFPKRYEQINRSKIVISGMRHFECVLDSSGDVIAGKSTVLLRAKNTAGLGTILGILNSKLISFYIKESYGALGIDGGINFTADLVQNLPLPILDKSAVKKVEIVVSKIVAITKDDNYLDNPSKQAEVKEYERQIDQMVYNLYGLTEEEIRIVEGG